MDVLEFMKRRADLQSLMLSAGTVFAGTAASVIRGNMEILPASVCLLFALFAQTGCNLYHFYAVMGRTQDPDVINRVPAKVNANRIAMRLLREGTTACLLVCLMLGLSIASMATHVWILILAGAFILAAAYFMAHSPRVYRNPLSLLLTFLVFGPVGVMATSFVQYQYEAPRSLLSYFDSAPSIYIGITMGFLACAHHITLSYYNNAIDAYPDRPGIIRSIGRRSAEVAVALCGVLAFAVLAYMAFWLGLPQPMLALVPGFIAFCINTYIAIRLHRAGVGELRYLNTLTRVNFLLTGLVSFILWWIIGAPDDSMRVIF